MADIVQQLRDWAKQIRRDAESTPHATSAEDSGLLDKAANEIERLRSELEAAKARG